VRIYSNAADEMAGFLRKAGILMPGYLEQDKVKSNSNYNWRKRPLEDPLVTRHSLHSRNRSFGNMIGKG
jgi:glycerol-3-phosphate dehydrogenase (NAD(P)+)